ncbi:MAG: hypothetical protein J0M37_15485 [Ignavibacteria bacterium]|nr:hypothetical protein [Ignavibacteria bacterium]
MRISIFLIIFIQFILSNDYCLGQTQYQLTIGGPNIDDEHSLIQVADGSYVLAGYTNPDYTQNNDFYIVKINIDDSIKWSMSLGGSGTDIAHSIIQTKDGGFAVVGLTNSYSEKSDACLIVKLDSNGALTWSRTVGGGKGEWCSSIVQTKDGGYAIAGYSFSFGSGKSDLYIFKLDVNGKLLWSKTIGGTDHDVARDIILTEDGGFALAGYTFSYGEGGSDYFIVKLDGYGNVEWSRTIGGTGWEDANSIIQTKDGSFVIAGYTDSFGAGFKDCYIVKLDASGRLQWSRTVGGTGFEEALSVIEAFDNGYGIAGYTNSFGAGGNDFYVLNLDKSGKLKWSKTVGGINYEAAESINQTTDGGFVIAGYTDSFGFGNFDIYIVKLSDSGYTCENSYSPVSILGRGGIASSVDLKSVSQTSILTSVTPDVSNGGKLTTICK